MGVTGGPWHMAEHGYSIYFLLAIVMLIYADSGASLASAPLVGWFAALLKIPLELIKTIGSSVLKGAGLSMFIPFLILAIMAYFGALKKILSEELVWWVLTAYIVLMIV